MNRNNNCTDDDDVDDNYNNNNYYNYNNDDDDGKRRCFMSAVDEVWKDLQMIVQVTPDLSSLVELEHTTELMKFPDERIEALAQSLIGDVYTSVSKCQNDEENIERQQNRLVTSLMSELDRQPHGFAVRMYTICEIVLSYLTIYVKNDFTFLGILATFLTFFNVFFILLKVFFYFKNVHCKFVALNI